MATGSQNRGDQVRTTHCKHAHGGHGGTNGNGNGNGVPTEALGHLRRSHPQPGSGGSYAATDAKKRAVLRKGGSPPPLEAVPNSANQLGSGGGSGSGGAQGGAHDCRTVGGQAVANTRPQTSTSMPGSLGVGGTAPHAQANTDSGGLGLGIGIGGKSAASSFASRPDGGATAVRTNAVGDVVDHVAPQQLLGGMAAGRKRKAVPGASTTTEPAKVVKIT